VDALEAFVVAGDFRPIVVDWAWITHHWERTDFAAVNAFVDALRKRGIEVLAMYRPRFLGTPTVPIQVKADDSPAWDHGSEIRYTNAEARAWGIRWGTEILEKCPGFGEIIVYNPRNVDQSPEAEASRTDPAGAHSAVAQFLAEAREAWKSVRPDVRVSVVSVNDPPYWNQIKDAIDVAHPYLLIKEDVDATADTFEMTQLASLLGDKMGVNLAKVTWGERDKVEPAKLQTFDAHARQYGFSYVLWTFDTLFDSPLYDPQTVAQALELDYAKLKPTLQAIRGSVPTETPAVAASEPARGRNQPGDWIYFTSRENTTGQPPRLELQFEDYEIDVPVLADVMVLAHIPDRNWRVHPDLSISLRDFDRVLLRFGSVNPRVGQSLRKAELVLDSRLSATPPKEPFELGVYHVLERWRENTAKWDNQPAFEPIPEVIAEVRPRDGIIRIDVTELVESWIEQGANQGMLLKVTSPMAVGSGQSSNEQIAETAEYPPDLLQHPGRVYPDAQPVYARSTPSLPPSPELALPPEPEWNPLPWPHEAPGLSEAERQQLAETVWIINDFPLYQCDERMAYFHTGLDFVLDNGTPIYAMEDGWVKSIAHGAVAVVAAKGPEPAFGWYYVHLGDIQVDVGQHVPRGTLIGKVDFDGLPHIHLDKLYSQDPYWGEWQYTLMPNRHFTYPDDEPPVIQTPYYFFRNESDEVFVPDASGTITVSGDVDIVVAMREQGLYARARDNGYGDRLGVAKIEYRIHSVESGKEDVCASFDFTRLVIKNSPTHRDYNTELTKIAYKHPRLFGPDTTRGNKSPSYYIITNAPAGEPARALEEAHSKLCWTTGEYPDGEYEITVRASDARGHSATARMNVTVGNDGSA
jgi:murein DD-endopeptidase MepM/ murein hydrolase activator NlpD